MASSSWFELVRDLFDNKAEVEQYTRERQRRHLVVGPQSGWWMFQLKDGIFVQHRTRDGLVSYFSFDHLIFYLTLIFCLFQFGRALYHFYFKYNHYNLLYNAEQRSHLAKQQQKEDRCHHQDSIEMVTLDGGGGDTTRL